MSQLYFILLVLLFSRLNTSVVYAHGEEEKKETARPTSETSPNPNGEQPTEPPIENRISELLDAAADFDPKKIKAAIEAMELPNGEGAAESKALLKKLADLDTSKLEGLIEKINTPEMKKFVKALTEMRKLSKDELLSKVFGTKDFKSAEARAMAQEFYKRLKEDPNTRIGFVVSPQNVRDLKERMKGFLGSEEGKKFIADLKEKLPGLASPKTKLLKGAAKENKPEDPYQKLGQAVKEWDEKNGGKLQSMGLGGGQMAETFKKIKEEIGVKELKVGIFLPDAAIKNSLHSLITEDIMPNFRKEIRTFAAKKAAEEVAKEVAKHPVAATFLPRIVAGIAAKANGQAQSGAAQGAEDAATGAQMRTPSGGEIYRKAYMMAYSQTQKKTKEVEKLIQEKLYGTTLNTMMTPSQNPGVTFSILRAGPPASGTFEQDSQNSGYAAKPYISLYNSTGTFAGWEAQRFDDSSNNLDKILTNGRLLNFGKKLLEK